MVVASSSSSKKKKNKKISDKKKASMKAKKKVSKTEKKAAKDGKCFHCGKECHQKRNWKEFLTTVNPKKGMVLVLETTLVEKSNNFWIINSRATNNVCTSLQGLQVKRKLSEGEFTLRVGTVISTGSNEIVSWK